MKKRRVLRALLCVAVVGGCTGRSIKDGPPPSAFGASAARPDSPETGRFTYEISANGPGRDVLLSAAGTFDHRRRRYSLEVGGATVAAATIPRRTIAVDGVLYVDFPDLAHRLGASTPWISAVLDGEDVLGLREFDPGHIMDLVGSRDARVERDRDGLVRRVTMRFDAPGEDGGVVLTVAYSDLGAPVTVDPPPGDQVTDETEALTRRGAATGG